MPANNTTNVEIYDENGKYKIGQLYDVKKIDCSINSEEKYNPFTNLRELISKDHTMSFTFGAPIDTEQFLRICGFDSSKMPDRYSIIVSRVTQKRKHKKKRVNKKWLKRYGYTREDNISNGWKIHCNTDGTFEFVK